MIQNIYSDGKYLKRHQTWHAEDSAWKAGHVYKMMKRNGINGAGIADIGCGAGGVLQELSRLMGKDIHYHGYDISPQAIDWQRNILARICISNWRICFPLITGSISTFC